MSLSVKVWSDKARQAAQAARRGEYTPGGGASTLSPAVQQRVKEILAEKANKGKKKAGGGKAKAKGRAGKDPQAAQEKAQEKAQRAAERAQRQKEHAEDRAQRAKEREQKQKEHDEDRAQKQKEHQEAAALRAKKEAEREQDRAARLKKQKKARKAMDIAIKAGARHSRTDQQHIQAIHDSAVACGADCSMDDEADDEGEFDDAGKAIKAMQDDPKYYAMHECGDIMQAASALSNLCMLMQSEMSEGDEDATDVSQLCDACRILLKFIESELDECESAASDSADTIGHEPMKALVSGDDATAQKLLARAVARHKRHMSGAEPTDEDSQQQLMDDMQAALKAIAKREDVNPKAGIAEYGDVPFADMKNKKYPIDTEAHIRAAYNYIHQEKNAAKYDPDEVKQIKARIIAAWKKKIDDAGPPSAESKAFDLIHVDGGAIKALDGDTIRGYAVLFGDAEHYDIDRDYYTKSTDFWMDHFGWPRPITYQHGMDRATRDAPIVGHWMKGGIDDVGVWLEGQIDRAHRYYKAVKELVARGYLKLSSDSAPQWVQRERQPNGTNFVKCWPLVTSSVTVSPMEPRMLPIEVKAFLAELGLEGIDTDSQEAINPDAARADELKAADERARALSLELDLLELETTE